MIASSLFTRVSFNGWNFEVCFISAGTKKSGRCGEVAVSGGSTVEQTIGEAFSGGQSPFFFFFFFFFCCELNIVNSQYVAAVLFHTVY